MTSVIDDREQGLISRRIMLKGTVSASVVAATALAGTGCQTLPEESSLDRQVARRGRINQSVVNWPFQAFGEEWDHDTLCRVARDLGCRSVELVDPDGWPTLAEYGLACAIAPNGMPGEPYVRGLNNLAYHEEIIERTRKVIEAAAASPVTVPAVIAFTGFKYRVAEDPASGEIPLDEGTANTVAGLKKLAALGERHGIEIHLEHLNTRIAGDNSRGHPGYQGDDIDYCADIIRAVGSQKVKLLFDVFHVQVMNGDVIKRIREYGTDLIGHIHTAGNPGRRELDDQQEINYPPIMHALLEIGYQGYVGHEFIPTRNPLQGLRQAVALCDV